MKDKVPHTHEQCLLQIIDCLYCSKALSDLESGATRTQMKSAHNMIHSLTHAADKQKGIKVEFIGEHAC